MWFYRDHTAHDREADQRAGDASLAVYDTDSSQSNTIRDEEDNFSFNFNRNGGSLGGILIIAGAVMSCCCCCYGCCYCAKNNSCGDDDGCDCSCDECALFSRAARVDHGVNSWERQRCQVSVLFYHVLMAPVDILVDLPALLLAFVILCT
eukprot:COSAG02_NODE_34737_length_479_cov_0.663158_1_plen_149_part_01